MAKILTVSQLNSYIKGVFDDELILQGISVSGEIFQFKVAAGNSYITLKEGDSTLNCVFFSSAVEYRAGQKVCLTGSVRFYPKSGKVSFVVSHLKPLGRGELLFALEQTRQKLKADGIFDNNRALPTVVTRVAIVTSEDGAVLHDFLSATKNMPYLTTVLYPVRVQGEGAAAEIVAAMSDIGRGILRPDCVILGNLGGFSGFSDFIGVSADYSNSADSDSADSADSADSSDFSGLSGLSGLNSDMDLADLTSDFDLNSDSDFDMNSGTNSRMNPKINVSKSGLNSDGFKNYGGQGWSRGSSFGCNISAVDCGNMTFDVVIVARGGGSAADLDEFNSEALARAIHACPVPVISAVGHQTDYTLCDFASDIRAGTPSIAGEMLAGNNRRFFQRLHGSLGSIRTHISQKLDKNLRRAHRAAGEIAARITARNQKAHSATVFAVLKTQGQLEIMLQKHRHKTRAACQKVCDGLCGKLTDGRGKLRVVSARIEESNPLKILSKGYAKICKNGAEVGGVSQLLHGDRVEIVMSDGRATASIDGRDTD